METSFGWSVSVDGDRVLVRATAGDMVQVSAWLFDFGVPPDYDGDGVPDSQDVYPGMVLPEDMPAYLKRNRYYADANGDFVDVDGVWSGITVVDTAADPAPGGRGIPAAFAKGWRRGAPPVLGFMKAWPPEVPPPKWRATPERTG